MTKLTLILSKILIKMDDMDTLKNKALRKFLNVEIEGTKVKHKKTGAIEEIKMTTINIDVELPFFFSSLSVRYTLSGRGEVSKKYFDMNYEAVV